MHGTQTALGIHHLDLNPDMQGAAFQNDFFKSKGRQHDLFTPTPNTKGSSRMTVTASNYDLRPNDLYETEAWAVDALVRACPAIRNSAVYEPAAGNHAIAEALAKHYCITTTSDIETYQWKHDFEADFLTDDRCVSVAQDNHWIITNPPYGKSNRLAVKFIERALEVQNVSIAMLLTAKFDFGKNSAASIQRQPSLCSQDCAS